MDATTASDVRQYYGETLKSTADLKTSACCATGTVAPHIKEILAKLPDPVISKFYGCGAPLPIGIEGMRVLDLGRCGSVVIRVVLLLTDTLFHVPSPPLGPAAEAAATATSRPLSSAPMAR